MTMTQRAAAVALAAGFAFAAPYAGFANMDKPQSESMGNMDIKGMKMGGEGTSTDAADPAAETYGAANARMQEAMAMDLTGDPDIDFARGMIPHHQGAVEMARAVLAHGKDPELRALAEEIIAAQESEITFLRGWLEVNDK